MKSDEFKCTSVRTVLKEYLGWIFSQRMSKHILVSCNSTQADWFLFSQTSVTRKYCKNKAQNGSVWLLKHLEQFQALKKVLCSDNYFFLEAKGEEIIQGRKLFKGGNYLLLGGFDRGNYLMEDENYMRKLE